MMNFNTITMAALERVLLRLGYVRCVVANSHLRFQPSEQQGGVILLPLFKADEVDPPIDLLMAEVTVDNWGIADRKTFERMLAESAAQTAAMTGTQNVAAASV